MVAEPSAGVQGSAQQLVQPTPLWFPPTSSRSTLFKPYLPLQGPSPSGQQLQALIHQGIPLGEDFSYFHLTSEELLQLSQQILDNPHIPTIIPRIPQEIVLPRAMPLTQGLSHTSQLEALPQGQPQPSSNPSQAEPGVALGQQQNQPPQPMSMPESTSPPLPEPASPPVPSQPPKLEEPSPQVVQKPKAPVMVNKETQTDVEHLSRRKRRALLATPSPPPSPGLSDRSEKVVELPVSWMGDLLKVMQMAQSQASKIDSQSRAARVYQEEVLAAIRCNRQQTPQAPVKAMKGKKKKDQPGRQMPGGAWLIPCSPTSPGTEAPAVVKQVRPADTSQKAEEKAQASEKAQAPPSPEDKKPQEGSKVTPQSQA